MKRVDEVDQKHEGGMKTNIIKKIFIVIAVIVALLPGGCKTKDLEELVLEIYSSEWYTKVDGFATVNLILSGYTNGTQVTVSVFGDGVPGEVELTLDENKNFQGDVCIKFSHSPGDEPFEQITWVRAYREDEYVEVLLESGVLRWPD